VARIAITLGDPAGIGPEITLKAVAELAELRNNLTIIGSTSILEDTKDLLSFSVPGLEVADTGEVSVEAGVESKQGGKASMDALRLACKLLKDKELDALVTAPLSKKAVQFSNPGFTGHTEFLAGEFGVGDVLMIAHSKKVSFAFVTTHLPLREVSNYITAERVSGKLLLYNDFLTKLAKAKPRIVVLAANPHGAEFSAGEENEIGKAIEKCRKDGLVVDGPYPADTFHIHMDKVDGFLACYHDQGMIPAKLLSAGEGVNVTWGLPFVRTSPLHGTAFDIAGKNMADPRSMIAAVRLAYELSRN